MKRCERLIEKETNKALLNDRQQLEEAIREILRREYLNDEENREYTAILNRCKEVHIGPKLEYHSHLPSTSRLTEPERMSKSILLKCKERLKNRYITNFAYMRSFFWDGKRNDLPIKDHFVELIVEKSNLFGKKEGEKINLEEIFSKEVDGHQTILFSGGSGYGKSTLCKKIAYDWAIDEMSSTYLKHFDFVVVILLREIDDKSLYELVLYNIFKNIEGEIKFKIENENLNILVMLDGFDEISNKSPVLKFIREESFDISLRMTILVTSRPESTEDIREDMKARFSVEGFSEQQQQKYIQLIFKDYKVKGRELTRLLKEEESFSEIRKCPLILHMLCCLYQNDDNGLMDRMTDLYIKMVSLLIERYRSKNDRNYKFIKGKHFYGEDLLIRLGKSNNIIFKDLNKLFPIKEEYNFIVGLGILEFNSFSAYDDQSYYEFVHFSFYEFIEALTIYFSDFSDICITDNILLFMMGLSEEEPFPKKIQDSFRMRYIEFKSLFLYKPKFMLRVYREMKIKSNWELFCSLSHLVFSYKELDDVKALLFLYNFTQAYFIFPENKSTYEIFRDNLTDFYKNYNILDKMVIFLFAGMDDIDTIVIMRSLFSTDEEKLDANIRDHREEMSCIIDFVNKIGPTTYKIYFSGLSPFTTMLYFFRNVERSLEISKIQELNAPGNEEFVALQIVNESSCVFVNYVISAEHYEILRDRIKIFSLSESTHSFKVS